MDFILEDSIDGIGEKGDTLIIKSDKTWELKKVNIDEVIAKAKAEIEISKTNACKDITKLYQELLQKWTSEGKGDIAPIEKIINSCKSEGGNIDKADAKDPSAVCGNIWFNGTDAQRSSMGDGAEGRGRTEKPPKAWWDDCMSKIK